MRVRLKAGGPFTYEGFVLILPQERTKQIGRSMAAPGLKRSRYVAPTTLKAWLPRHGLLRYPEDSRPTSFVAKQ